MKHVLAFGGGVDSTALLLMHLHRDAAALADIDVERVPHFDAVAFADPGAEWPQTYANVALAAEVCAARGLEFVTVRKGEVAGTGRQETITEWVLRLGIVPLMPGGSHICSLKFKGEVLQAWAKQRFSNEPICWSVGIEADETGRVSRFTARDTSKAGLHSFIYPLVELGLDRVACEAFIASCGWPGVHKSSCRFCPFMQEWEIREALADPETRDLLTTIEAAFEATSAAKHQAWQDAGQPVDSAGRAPVGMWRRDSWADGARLFSRGKGGRKASVAERLTLEAV